MPEKESGPKAGLEGVVEDVKGKAKDLIGKVTGNEDLQAEGKAQQEKADAKRDVAEHEAKADAARAESEVHEAEQRVQQRAKEA